MKLLILTCSTGGGHTSAAMAIAQAANRAGIESRVEDALQFLPGFDGKVISYGHTFVYRHLPSLFGVGYRYEQKKGGARFFRSNVPEVHPRLDCIFPTEVMMQL